MANKVESGSNGLSQMDKVATFFFLLIVETNFWEISSIRDEIIMFKEMGFRLVLRRTICVCDGLETCVQAQIRNEATIFFYGGDVMRFTRRNKLVDSRELLSCI